ncbi:hypothetical protein ACQ4PT_050050 [Festuca glaucescens]
MFWDMAADSSMGMGMGFHQGGSSFHHHHHGMLSFQSNPDSAPAPASAPPPAPAVFLPPPNAPAPQGAPPYKFVTGSPSDWTEYELAIFKEGLVRYAREPTIMKYIKIAAMLPTRTIRDVALRCQWTAGKESRRRKPDEFYAGKRTRDLKEKMVASTSKANFQMAPPNNLIPFSTSMHYPGRNSLITNEVPVVDNATQHLLEENIQLLSQISANIETFKLGENMDLFLRTNNNIRTILKRMSETPGIMGQMRPLPEAVNEDSLSSLLQLDRVVSSQPRVAINDYYLSTEMKHCSLKLENVDTQPSLEGSVFVFVTGSFTMHHADKYKFAQSFLLAPQADGGYFILNDVLRYFLEVPSTQTNEALVGHNNVNTNTEAGPVPADPGTSSVIDKGSSEKRNAQTKNAVSMIPDAAPAPVKSYASILKAKDQAEDVQESSSVPARTTVRPVSDDQSYSICVKNLPLNATVEVVQAEFSKFGSIKPVYKLYKISTIALAL